MMPKYRSTPAGNASVLKVRSVLEKAVRYSSGWSDLSNWNPDCNGIRGVHLGQAGIEKFRG